MIYVSRPKKTKKAIPRGVLEERRRLVQALMDTFARLWKERSKKEGNTQTATAERAGLSVQQFGNWKRGDDDMTLTSAVAVAFALDRRIDFDLSSVSDPSDRVPVVTNEEGETVSDDVLRLAEEIDKLPDAQKLRIMGAIDGMLTMARTQRSPSEPAAEQRGHSGRSSK